MEKSGPQSTETGFSSEGETPSLQTDAIGGSGILAYVGSSYAAVVDNISEFAGPDRIEDSFETYSEESSLISEDRRGLFLGTGIRKEGLQAQK